MFGESGISPFLTVREISWWRHQMEAFSALLTLCEGNPPVVGGFPSQGQWHGALIFSLIYKRLNTQWRRRWFDTSLRSSWRHCDIIASYATKSIIQLRQYPPTCSWCCMMTSSNGNILRVTGPLWGEFTGDQWIPSQRPVTRSFDVFFDLHLLNGWVNNRNTGDLRLHRAHYDVSVMA